MDDQLPEVGASFGEQDLPEPPADQAERAFEHGAHDVAEFRLARKLQADRAQGRGLLARARQLDRKRRVVAEQPQQLDLLCGKRAARRAFDVQRADRARLTRPPR